MAVFSLLLVVVLLIGVGGVGLQLLWLTAVVGALVALIARMLSTGSRNLRVNQ